MTDVAAPARRALARAPLAALFLLGAVHAALVLASWWQWLMCPHCVGGVEVIVLNSVLAWKAGHPPYSHLREPPALWSPYGPLYQGLCALLPVWPSHPYLTGRLVSLAALAAIGGMLAYVAARRRHPWVAGIVALLLLTARPIVAFGVIYRVDLLAACLSLAGFLLLVSGKSRAGTAAGVTLLVLAFLTKLTAVAGILAYLLLTWPFDRKRGLAVTAAWGLGAGLSLGAVQWWTGGAYLYDLGLLTDSGNPLKALDMVTRPLTSSGFWMAALLLALRGMSPESRRTLRPEWCYCGASLAITGVTGIHDGSSWNYLVDFYVALSLATVGLLAHLAAGKGGGYLRGVTALLTLQTVFSLWYSFGILDEQNRKLAHYGGGLARAVAVIQPRVRAHQRVAVIDSDRGTDALLLAGQYNPVSFPPVRLRAQRDALLSQALRDRRLDGVLHGSRLEPWTGRSTPTFRGGYE